MTASKQCGNAADYAVHTPISTKRVRPRVQKCSRAVSLREHRIQAFLTRTEIEVPCGLLESLQTAALKVGRQ